MSKKNENYFALTSAEGYPLKGLLLRKWIYDNGYTLSYIASKMGLSFEKFKRKLRHRESFDYWQIKPLVLLMGAEAAFQVIYFPSKKRRYEVWWEVFGQFQSQEELNE